MNIRKAVADNIPSILNIFDEARNFQRASGFVQWIDGYPNREILESDIKADTAYVVEINSRLVGYFFIAYNDCGYENVTDVWCWTGPFAVVHRLALADAVRGTGLSTKIFTYAESLASEGGAASMRVDTGGSNIRMQKLMDRLGYVPKGNLNFPWGQRLGYEKKLRNPDKNPL